MKKLTICPVFTIVLLTLISFQGMCQYNLVPNHSFELFTTCPTSLNQLPYATYWTKGVTNVSPEFFHGCAGPSNPYSSVPQNRFGYQHARTGIGYLGICSEIYNSTNPNQTYREYIQTELLDTLVSGVEYAIQFYVSAADSCGRLTNNIGAYFSNVEIDTVIFPNSNLSFQPQYENPETNDLGDRLGWTLISGTFIANGGEKFLVIGNFRPDSTTTVTLSGWGNYHPNVVSAYHYVDDVLVSPKDSLTSIIELNSNDEISISTVNSSEYVIDSKYQYIKHYEIINNVGQIIHKKQEINMNSFELKLTEFANGIYFVRLQLNDEKICILKIFKFKS